MKPKITKKIKKELVIDDIKTPMDNRTLVRKWLKCRALEVSKCTEAEFGFWTYMRLKDFDYLTVFCLN